MLRKFLRTAVFTIFVASPLGPCGIVPSHAMYVDEFEIARTKKQIQEHYDYQDLKNPSYKQSVALADSGHSWIVAGRTNRDGTELEGGEGNYQFRSPANCTKCNELKASLTKMSKKK